MSKHLPFAAASFAAFLASQAALADVAFSGRVLPFKIDLATGNKDLTMVEAFVDGGDSDRWAATAVHITEKVTALCKPEAVHVKIYRDNPWGADSPQEYKTLAEVYYNPDSKSGPWGIFVAQHAAKNEAIEYDVKLNEYLKKHPGKSSDKPVLREIIAKYHLPKNWQPPAPNVDGTEYPRDAVRIADTHDGDASIADMAVRLQRWGCR